MSSITADPAGVHFNIASHAFHWLQLWLLETSLPVSAGLVEFLLGGGSKVLRKRMPRLPMLALPACNVAYCILAGATITHTDLLLKVHAVLTAH